jgi:hypothetical protein
MCARQGFVSVLETNELVDSPLLGTFEQRDASCTTAQA